MAVVVVQTNGGVVVAAYTDGTSSSLDNSGADPKLTIGGAAIWGHTTVLTAGAAGDFLLTDKQPSDWMWNGATFVLTASGAASRSHTPQQITASIEAAVKGTAGEAQRRRAIAQAKKGNFAGALNLVLK